DSMPGLQADLGNSVANLEPRLAGLEAPVVAVESAFSGPLTEDAGYSASLSDLVNFVSSAPELQVSTEMGAQMASVLASYNNIQGQKTDKLQTLSDTKLAFLSALQDYRDVVAAHPGDLAAPEVQDAVFTVRKYYQSYSAEAAAFENWLNQLEDHRNVLSSLSQQLRAKVVAEIDATTFGSRRNDLRTELNNLSSVIHGAAQSLNTAAQNQWQPMDALREKFGSASDGLAAYDNARQAEQSAYLSAYAQIDGLHSDLSEYADSQKAQIAFLLDTTGNEDTLDQLQSDLERKSNLRAAKINRLAAALVREVIVDAAPESLEVAMFDLNSRLMQQLLDLDLGDEDQRNNVEAIKLAKSFLTGHAASLAPRILESDADLGSELAEVEDRAQLVLDFYQNGAALSESERNDIRTSGTDTDRMLLSEYYNPGSTFLFQGALQASGGDAARQSFAQFREAVSTEKILHAAMDQELAAQEDPITGLLAQLQDAVPALS
ncbi:MAG: hypothetical protein KDK37_18385, partial [Leptospiraceae bacterium]|nr:hypothetical protein [Leptospiraceae bacterium]